MPGRSFRLNHCVNQYYYSIHICFTYPFYLEETELPGLQMFDYPLYLNELLQAV